MGSAKTPYEAINHFLNRNDATQRAQGKELRLTSIEAASLASSLTLLASKLSELQDRIIVLQQELMAAQKQAIEATKKQVVEVKLGGGNFEAP